MASTVEICNLALSNLGTGKEIANLVTEKSNEASTLRRYYEPTRRVVLRDANWPFATKFKTLGLVEENPNIEWAYAYRYPTDCLKVRRFLNGVSRVDTRDSRVPFKLGQDEDGLLIFTDMENAEIEYTVDVSDPTRFPSDFVMALAWRLAAYSAPRITAGDPFKLGPNALQMYRLELGNALVTSYDEEQADELPDSEFIRDRW